MLTPTSPSSIVIVLRLWRVFKIIEEFSSGAEEQVNIKQNRNRAVTKVRLDGYAFRACGRVRDGKRSPEERVAGHKEQY